MFISKFFHKQLNITIWQNTRYTHSTAKKEVNLKFSQAIGLSTTRSCNTFWFYHEINRLLSNLLPSFGEHSLRMLQPSFSHKPLFDKIFDTANKRNLCSPQWGGVLVKNPYLRKAYIFIKSMYQSRKHIYHIHISALLTKASGSKACKHLIVYCFMFWTIRTRIMYGMSSYIWWKSPCKLQFITLYHWHKSYLPSF